MYIPRHKVFISYYHHDDQYYKDKLISFNELNPNTWQIQSIFEDYSVHENEIDDTGLSSENIRCIIRDDYIKDATVLILLCGQNTKRRNTNNSKTYEITNQQTHYGKCGTFVCLSDTEREQRRDHRQKPSQSRKRNHDSGSHVHSWARRGYRNISG